MGRCLPRKEKGNFSALKRPGKHLSLPGPGYALYLSAGLQLLIKNDEVSGKAIIPGSLNLSSTVLRAECPKIFRAGICAQPLIVKTQSKTISEFLNIWILLVHLTQFFLVRQ